MPRVSELITQSYLNGDAGLGQLPAPFENRFDEVNAQLADIAINVKNYGAIIGSFDSTAAIQAAINFAASINSYVFVPPGTYTVSTLLLKPGLRGFVGQGATLVTNTPSAKVINTTTNNLDLSQQVNNCIIKGFTINMNSLASMGIHVYGSNNRVSDCYVYGAKPGSQLVRITYDSHNNHVFDCTLISLIDEPFGTYLDMSCVIVEGKQYNTEAGLDVSDEVIPGTNTSYDNKIYNNYLEGGTHTIGLRQAERTLISGNTVKRGSHRGIVLSPYACSNLIDNNYFVDCGSSSVHMAYGSSNNFVTNNRILNLSNPAVVGIVGEGEIQAYVHTKNNTITGNDITTFKRYGIYTAINSDGTTIKNNTVRGGLIACIAVESDWSPLPLPAGAIFSRPNYGPPSNPAWTSWDNGKGLNNITISGNTLYHYTDATITTGIYVAQMLSSVMDGVIVDNNKIIGKVNFGNTTYIYCNDAAKFTNVNIMDNVDYPNQPLKNVIYNPATSLTSYKNNSWQSQQISINISRIDGSGLIDVSIYDNYYIIVSSVTINGFKGLVVVGRKLTLRIFPSVTLTHSSSLRLKGAINVTTPSANDNNIMEFVYIGGSWVESARNF